MHPCPIENGRGAQSESWGYGELPWSAVRVHSAQRAKK
eukprot:CAMPEP_0204512854 /NCGR_PEP_ID=MMETSP0661-20131031/1180_1 /ASSEMBLY_ACC=CAM_ASM_000606 /TAXON_ID=109239 /ORGANISM="Alexandrium margalefi, Strain AMGDE01CS-322" /LENGTH=37 /DNA_ID= /DNA_START= /DNA_END= /DNA_ORIENTATION=